MIPISSYSNHSLELEKIASPSSFFNPTVKKTIFIASLILLGFGIGASAALTGGLSLAACLIIGGALSGATGTTATFASKFFSKKKEEAQIIKDLARQQFPGPSPSSDQVREFSPINRQITEQSIRLPKEALPVPFKAKENLPVNKENVAKTNKLDSKEKIKERNLKLISSLKNEIKKADGDETLVDEFFNHSQMQSYVEGQRLLTKKDADIILQDLQPRAKTRKIFNGLLQAALQAVKEGAITNQKALDDQFPLAHVLKSLPPTEQQHLNEKFQHTVNQAYIQIALKQRGRFVESSSEEKLLLHSLGYDLEHLPDKRKVYIIFKKLVEEQTEQGHFKGSLDSTKQILMQCGAKARLKALGFSSPLHFQKFQESLRFMRQTFITLSKVYQDFKLNLPKVFNDLPLAAEYFKDQFNSSQQEIIEGEIERIFSSQKIREAFTDSTIKASNFENLIGQTWKDQQLNIEDRLLKDYISNLKDTDIQKELSFYLKWGKYLKTEVIQGLKDKNEILWEGICWGLSQRIRHYAQDKPLISSNEMAQQVNSFTSEDRYLQAIHDMATNLGAANGHLLPSVIARKRGSDERLFFNVKLSASQQSALDAALRGKERELPLSNGWLRLDLLTNDSGHTILLRLDEKTKHAWLFDPNVGLLCFEDKHPDFNEARKTCLETLNGLIQHMYPETNIVQAFQLQK